MCNHGLCETIQCLHSTVTKTQPRMLSQVVHCLDLLHRYLWTIVLFSSLCISNSLQNFDLLLVFDKVVFTLQTCNVSFGCTTFEDLLHVAERVLQYLKIECVLIPTTTQHLAFTVTQATDECADRLLDQTGSVAKTCLDRRGKCTKCCVVNVGKESLYNDRRYFRAPVKESFADSACRVLQEPVQLCHRVNVAIRKLICHEQRSQHFRLFFVNFTQGTCSQCSI